ncbi:hypothetical protein [Streptomyces sp. NBC_00963]|uniref:hypothetical protein n=1 Tax=Streptomyces sp. NBC_00963 TaxID=2903697 RepID=UPI003870281C
MPSKSNMCSTSVMESFPDELVQAQREWSRTYAELSVPRPRNPTALRRRLLRLSLWIEQHPFFRTGPGRSPAARFELRRLVRETERRADVS